MEVVVEAGAGYPDADYVAKGARVAADRAEVFRTANIIVQVLCNGANDKSGPADVPLLRRDQALIAFFARAPHRSGYSLRQTNGDGGRQR